MPNNEGLVKKVETALLSLAADNITYEIAESEFGADALVVKGKVPSSAALVVVPISKSEIRRLSFDQLQFELLKRFHQQKKTIEHAEVVFLEPEVEQQFLAYVAGYAHAYRCRYGESTSREDESFKQDLRGFFQEWRFRQGRDNAKQQE